MSQLLIFCYMFGKQCAHKLFAVCRTQETPSAGCKLTIICFTTPTQQTHYEATDGRRDGDVFREAAQVVSRRRHRLRRTALVDHRPPCRHRRRGWRRRGGQEGLASWLAPTSWPVFFYCRIDSVIKQSISLLQDRFCTKTFKSFTTGSIL